MRKQFGDVILLLLWVAISQALPINPPSDLLVDWKPSGYAQGIESRYPIFSWAVLPNCTDCWVAAQQSAYQILVASSLKLINGDIGDVWNSGTVYSNSSSYVVYQGGGPASDDIEASIHKAYFNPSEDISLQCSSNMHISSINELVVVNSDSSDDAGHTQKQRTLEALKRKCIFKNSCIVPNSILCDSPSLLVLVVWSCAVDPLQPATTYYWKVRLWFNDDMSTPYPYSQPSAFTTSLYGEWNDAVAIYGSSPSGFVYLRTEQNVTNPDSCSLQAATIFVTAAESYKLLSAYKLYVNNLWIGSGPGRNNSYNQQLYDSFDVYNIFQNYSLQSEIPVVLAAECFHLTSGAFQLSLFFQYLCKNATVVSKNVISSSQKWKSFPANSIYNPTGSSGKIYIQPHEYINGQNWISGWQSFAFNDSSWQYASLSSPFAKPLIAKPTLPIEVSVVPIVNLTKVGTGHYFFYLEREVMGGIILTVNNPETYPVIIEIRLGEELNGPESVMYQMRTGNVYQDFWTLKPGNNNLRHHEYMEWRYGEILNFTGILSVTNINVWTYNYPFSLSLSSFTSSYSPLTQIYDLCKYTVKATSLDMLTDSNTRERQPYEADMYIAAMSLLSVMPSYPILRATLAWLLEYPTWPTEWHLLTNSAAYLDYMVTGDPWIAVNFWTTLTSNSFIQQYFNQSLGLIDKPVDATNGINDLVDWPAVMRDNYVMTNIDTVINAHVYHAASILASLAQVTNHSSSIPFFSNAVAQLYKNVNSKLINSSGIYVDGLNINHTAAHASAFSLAFGLVEPANVNNVIQFLLGKGMVGSPYFAHFLLDGLYNTSTMAGAQGAFELIVSDEENSWLAMLMNGATMTTEMWNYKEKPNMSWSHPWSTTPLIMITNHLMGITWLAPAYSEVRIAPLFPSSMPLNASITLPTIRGAVSVRVTTILSDPSDKLLVFSHLQIDVTLPVLMRGQVWFYIGSDEMLEGGNRESDSEKKRVRGRGLATVVVDGTEVEEIWEGRALVLESMISGGTHQLIAQKRV